MVDPPPPKKQIEELLAGVTFYAISPDNLDRPVAVPGRKCGDCVERHFQVVLFDGIFDRAPWFRVEVTEYLFQRGGPVGPQQYGRE